MLKPSIACSVALLVAHGAFAELRLVPEPRQVTSGTGHFALRGAIPIIVPSGDAEDLFAAGLLAEEIRTRTGAEPRIASQGSGPIVLSREALPEVGDQGYRIDAAPNGIRVRARTATGLFYGVQTLRQMIDSDGVPAATIVDWPALAWRGFHDDLSRGPVPTLASLERQVRTAAEYKMNLYALYMEHSFAYRSEPLIAPPGGALTATELKELDAYAKLHHVSLLLEQQTLSHLEGMLTWEKYRGLAEQPGSDMLTPASPLTYALIDSLLAEIAPLSSAPFLHIGADEASDLGQGQSRPLVEARGLAAAYVQHVRRVHDLLAHHGKRTIFWGDFVMKHPERLGDLPTDCIVASWSFEPLDSYADYLEPFRTAKLDVLVCPGVCNWSRVFPNLGAAIPNIRRFTLEGQRRGAIGQLDCSWDDGGEALAALLWYPALYGAAAAWQAGDCDPERFRKAFDWAFFRNPGTEMAEAIACLDSAHTIVSSVRPTDMTIELSWLNPVRSGLDRQLLAMLAPVAKQLRATQERALERIARTRIRGGRNLDLLDAYQAAALRMHTVGQRALIAQRIRELYQRALATQTGDKNAALSSLREMLGQLAQGRARAVELRALYEQAWLTESRPYWLGNLLAQFDDDIATWQHRSEELRVHTVRMRNGAPLPSLEQIGLAP